jgi:outer membrane protein assembly factor BamB
MKFTSLASLLIATAVSAAPAHSVATGVQTTPAHSDWPKYCGSLGMTGTAQSAGNLSNQTAPFYTLAWSAQLSGPIASQPTVVGDLVYIGDWSGMEWGLDATTGITVAQAYLGTTSAPQCDPSNLGITSSATVSNGILYIAGGDTSFYALDAQTLDVVWSQYLGDNSAGGGYYGWCSPAVAGSKVIQGIASNCDNPFVPGRVVGLGLFDGSLTSEALLITPDWPHDVTGSGVWTSPSVDEANHDVFVTTASANQIDDGYAYSIVRLDLDSLTIQESWKLTDADPLADADWGTSPTLFTDSTGNQMVGAGEKDGHYYAFPRRGLTSGPIWKTQLAKGGACPLCADGILSTAAFDGMRLYVGSGRPPDVADDIIGAVYALNPDDGTILWQQTFAAPVIAPISYANGVVFTTVGKTAVALDAETGTKLWSADTEAVCVGGVAVTDRGIVFGDMAGNLYAYAIPPNVSTKTHAFRSR